ncbi:hypothetical protein KJ966_23665 [bacterium]|nr:hypothetical protein [bacterium]
MKHNTKDLLDNPGPLEGLKVVVHVELHPDEIVKKLHHWEDDIKALLEVNTIG